MNRSKDHYMVAQCSSCRKYRGDIPILGGHSSSHDSRKRYLPDAYLEKSPIFEERAQKHNSRGSNGHKWSMFYASSALHQSDIPCSKGEILFRGRSKALRQGEQPQGKFKQGGAITRGEWPFAIDVKGGEIITLM
jgi:hypothetical protein